MLVVVVLLVLVVVVVVGAVALRRRGSDEVHSIDGYRHTLETLQGIRSRSPSSVRIITSSSSEPESTPGPDPAALRPTRPGEPMVFEDPALASPMGPDRNRESRRAMASISHRPRRLGPAILAVGAAVLLVVVLVVAGTHIHRHRTTTNTTAAPSSGTHAATGSGSHAATGSGTHAGRVTTTTTTLPPNFTAASTTASSATYVPPSSSYTLGVSATHGDCWVLATSVDQNRTLYNGVLRQGAAQTFPSTGLVKVQLGAPGAVTLSLDNLPVVLPSSLSSPYTLVFQPAQSVSGVATTTTAPARGVAP